MKTSLLNKNNLNLSVQIINKSGIVAMPTETVYGLAASAFDEKAIKRVFEVKGRPSDNPLIVHIADIEDIYEVVSEFPPIAQKLAEKFWPGPLTMILPKKSNVLDIVSAGLSSVAVRMPSHPLAREFIRKVGVPLVAPSANLSGKPSPTKLEHVVNDLNGKADAIIDGGDCQIGLESTVVSLLDEKVKILRPGAITFDDLKQVVKNIEIDKAVYEKLDSNSKVLSPGMKYKHYAPDANVFVVRGSSGKYCDFVNAHKDDGTYALCFDEDIPFLKIPYISYGSEKNSGQQAHHLFGALRQLDVLKAKVVYAHFGELTGIGTAVYNRLVRAAGFKVIEL